MVNRNQVFLWIGIVLTVLLIVVVVWPLDQHQVRTSVSPASTPVSLGARSSARTVEDFELKDFNGKKFALHEVAGKPVLLEFFADWCKACHAQMPMIEKINTSYRSDAVIMGIHLAATEHRSRAAKMLSDAGVTFRTLSDTDGAIYARYSEGQRALPLAVLLDRDHVIAKVFRGSTTEKNLQDALDAAVR